MPFKLSVFIPVLTLAAFVAGAEDAKPAIDASLLPPASTQQGVTFDKDILPIFKTSCIRCHSADNPKPKGKLRLNSLDAVLKGGKNAPDVIPGDSAKSPLVAAVAHVGDEDDFMPPPKNKAKIAPLTKDQVGLIRAWIDQGAK